MARSDIPEIQLINETKLCNLLSYGNYSIIDARKASQYESSAILGSINCPPPENFDQMITERNHEQFTLNWISDNCISSQNKEKFAWLPLLKTIITGDCVTDPWVLCLYEIFLNAKFKYHPEYLEFSSMKQHYPLLFTPKGESTTFKKFRYPSEIISNFLWLGSVESAQDRKLIDSLQITHIVNATIRSRRNFFPETIKYLTVDILDEISEDMSSFFAPVNQFIDQAQQENGRVLIHCQAGISRSACLTVNYLRVRNHWTLKDALEFVIQQRPEVHPNRSFMEQLIEQEALANPDHVTSIQFEDIGPHGGVKEKFIRRMTSTNSSLSIETTNSEVKSVSSLREPLVPISESGQQGDRRGEKKKKPTCLCCVLS
jgi:protein-tyrosine phosphatase